MAKPRTTGRQHLAGIYKVRVYWSNGEITERVLWNQPSAAVAVANAAIFAYGHAEWLSEGRVTVARIEFVLASIEEVEALLK